jgi:hypothetical protein
MASAAEERALALIAKAEKKLNGAFFLGVALLSSLCVPPRSLLPRLGLSGVRSSRWAGMFAFGNGKYEEAAELYGQAAKQYQLGKNCESPPLLLPARAPETET